MTVGIGITTRNRPHILRLALEHFAHFGTDNAKYVVVDDNSYGYKSSDDAVKPFLSSLDIKYIKSTHRLGVATAKNTCLHYLRDCDDVFLFDDDAWPMKSDWSEKWIETSKVNQIEHSMYISEALVGPNSPPFFFIADSIGEEPYVMNAWNACMGVALHFTRNCLNRLGGYDSDSCRNYYGYEHAQMSVRAAQAGFTKGHRYLAPALIAEWIYSVDITHNMFHQPIPLNGKTITGFHSSVTDYEMSSASQNSQMMNEPKIHIPINTQLIP